MIEDKYSLINIEVVKKERINKILIFITLAVVVVTSSTICGLLIGNRKNKHIEKEPEIEDVNVNGEIEQVGELEKTKKPIYSEDAKKRLENIYKSEELGDGMEEEKIAYLTFDDGPSQTVTTQILEILKNEEIKATFFVLGSRVELYPEIVKREYDEGHYIANHGYSHVYTNVYSSAQAVLDEYNNTEVKIKEAIGDDYSSHLFRFPGGSEGGKYAKIKNEAKKLLEENNIAYINWNALTNDSVGKPTYESLVQDLKLTAKGKNKIVVLMHDTGAKQLTADSLTEIIRYLKEQGYIFKNFYDIMY